MISVASEISKETPDFTGKVSQLPVQVSCQTPPIKSFFCSHELLMVCLMIVNFSGVDSSGVKPYV